MNIDQLLSEALKKTEAWAIVIMQPKVNKLVCSAHKNLPEDWQTISNSIDDSSANGKCFLNNEVVLLKPQSDLPAGASTRHNMTCVAVIPIKREGIVIGTLETIKDTENAQFSENEITFLQTIANKLALII